MLVTLGPRDKTDDLVDLLAACHRRIREHLSLARRLAAAGDDIPADEVQATALRIRRYFEIALPQHRADEEEDIAPRLRGKDAELDAMLEAMEAEHVLHEAPVERLVALCRAIEQDAQVLRVHQADLAVVTDALVRDFATHLEAEERLMFPALRMMPRAERDEIRAKLRARRADGLGVPGNGA